MTETQKHTPEQADELLRTLATGDGRRPFPFSERQWLLYKLGALLDSDTLKGALAPMFVAEAVAMLKSDADLLAACRMAHDFISRDDIAALVRAAIAKAEGGAS